MENREELPRVSLESIQDWQKMRANYKEAALTSLRAQISARGVAKEQDALLAHLEQVRTTMHVSMPPF